MNKLFISIAIMTIATTAFAQSEQEIVSSETPKNSWGAKLIESNFFVLHKAPIQFYPASNKYHLRHLLF